MQNVFFMQDKWSIVLWSFHPLKHGIDLLNSCLSSFFLFSYNLSGRHEKVTWEEKIVFFGSFGIILCWKAYLAIGNKGIKTTVFQLVFILFKKIVYFKLHHISFAIWIILKHFSSRLMLCKTNNLRNNVITFPHF